MTQARSSGNRLAGERGEVASWLILMAGLAMAATLAAGVMGATIVELAERVRGAEAPSAEPFDLGVPGLPAIPDVSPAEGTHDPANEPGPRSPSDPVEDDTAHHDPAADPASSESEPSTSDPEPAPLESETQAALDRIIDDIDNGDDLGISEGELDDIRDELAGLTPEEREQVIAALTDEQLDRLFHNVHSSGFWSNDWNDQERNEFYGLLSGLSQDLQQRLSNFTDYFDLYDSDLDPTSVPISEQDYVETYEAITNLDIDEFLALRAYMWDHPELIEDSPFDWYADGCSIPGGIYPGALNGPCLLHDFAYTNARLAAFRFDPDYIDVDGNDIAAEWKQHADERLRTDIRNLPPSLLHNWVTWGEVVYTGVSVDPPVGPSGKKAFEAIYRGHYGPGFDPNLGQWPDDWNNSYTMRSLSDLATVDSP